VSDSGLQRLENDYDVLSLCKIGLANPKKKVHVYLEHVEPEGGLVIEIGLEIEIDVLPLNCNAEKVVVLEDSTQNVIEDMDVDGANNVGKGGLDGETGVVGVETQVDVQDAKTKVVGVETQVNNGVDDDEVKEHDKDANFFYHSESDLDYVYVHPKNDG